MSTRYNPPPNWPPPPPGWTPGPGWRPDPSWPPAPPGWQLWVSDPSAPPAPSNAGTAMIAVPAATCGLAGFVPPLWAARQRPDDPRFRRRMYLAAAASAALAVLGFVMVGSGDPDAGGSPTGLLSSVGTILLVLNLAGSVTLAVLVRNARPAAALPGVAEALARRQLRDQYRRLAADDPALARSLLVGRPDLPRTIDDGGLVDVNSIPAGPLAAHTGLTAAEATRVTEARAHLGRFVSIEELAVHADLPDPAVVLLRDLAVVYGG